MLRSFLMRDWKIDASGKSDLTNKPDAFPGLSDNPAGGGKCPAADVGPRPTYPAGRGAWSWKGLEAAALLGYTGAQFG